MDQIYYIFLFFIFVAFIATLWGFIAFLKSYGKEKGKLDKRGIDDSAERAGADLGSTFAFDIRSGVHGTLVNCPRKGVNADGVNVYKAEIKPMSMLPYVESIFLDNLLEAQLQYIRVYDRGFYGKKILLIWPTPAELAENTPYVDSEAENRRIISVLRKGMEDLADENWVLRNRPQAAEAVKKDLAFFRGLLTVPKASKETVLAGANDEKDKT